MIQLNHEHTRKAQIRLSSDQRQELEGIIRAGQTSARSLSHAHTLPLTDRGRTSGVRMHSCTGPDLWGYYYRTINYECRLRLPIHLLSLTDSFGHADPVACGLLVNRWQKGLVCGA